MHESIPRRLASVAILAALLAGAPAIAAAAPRSPGNQVFQWAFSGACSAWPDGSTSKATGFLWIPEHCGRLRGLLILGTNVPEHTLVGHPAIRSACADKGLGIVWFVPTFWNFNTFATQAEGAKQAGGAAEAAWHRSLRDIHARFLQAMLDGLADVSGYDEVAAVPWLPLGESAHLLMVTGLVDARPDRCIAAICIKNPQYPQDRTVPMLWTFGTGQEWGQSKVDIRTEWRNVTGPYEGWSRGRSAARWPLSLSIEPGTGHFHCSDAMAELFGRFIRAAVDARLAPDGGHTLLPVDLDAGVVADLPVPGHAAGPPVPHAGATADERRRPWFFDEATARLAQQIAACDWDAETRLPGFEAVAGCTVKPFSLNSVTDIDVVADGEFAVRGVTLDRIPAGFVAAEAPLATAPGAPAIEWICGPIVPLGDGRFRIAPDRTYPATTAYIAAILGAADGRRTSLQPARVKLLENRTGDRQTISFPPLPDVPVGTVSIPLVASADSELPVGFAVESGPAIVEGDRLVFTGIPPRASFPLRVTVAAGQWGRATHPPVQTAAIVRRSFAIVKTTPAPQPAGDSTP